MLSEIESVRNKTCRRAAMVRTQEYALARAPNHFYGFEIQIKYFPKNTFQKYFSKIFFREKINLRKKVI
jgi:hypothetical protein